MSPPGKTPACPAITSTAAGFSLVESLVALAIAAAVVALALPQFRALLLEARISGAVNGFIHGIHVARAEAARRHVPVVLCRSADGRRCAPAAPGSSGWIVFANLDGDQPPQVDRGEPLLQSHPGLPGGQITANRQAFIFRRHGLRAVNGTLVFCDRRGIKAARLVVVSYTGRPRSVLARNHDGAVTCPV